MVAQKEPVFDIIVVGAEYAGF